MRRRRRQSREIPFSFDSFLDVVANVVGIIIRLILVAWVGARSYQAVVTFHPPGTPKQPALAKPEKLPQDPLQDELARHQHELALLQDKMLEEFRQLQDAEGERVRLEQKVGSLASENERLKSQREAASRAATEKDKTIRTVALSLEELRQRREKLIADFRELERTAPPKRVLRYRTPVSSPVQAEEFFFECRAGRVTFLDIGSLLAEVRQDMEEKGKALRDTWRVEGETSPVGAFRLRYALERERDMLDSVGLGVGPDTSGTYRYGLSEWIAEPVTPVRGETLQETMMPASMFRQISDRLDPQLDTVTFWVYPDSFALYRALRDHLYQRDLVVAGRPLPDGLPISSSRRGSVSRGQ